MQKICNKQVNDKKKKKTFSYINTRFAITLPCINSEKGGMKQKNE